MDPHLAFPIMAGAAAFCVAGASMRLVRHERELDLRVVLAMALGGIPAVLVAAFVVKEMPLDILRWVVVAVVTYAGLSLLRSASRGTVPAVATLEA